MVRKSTKAVSRRCSVKIVFLKNSQNAQEKPLSESKRLKLTVKTPEQSQWRILQNFINTPFFKETWLFSQLPFPKLSIYLDEFCCLRNGYLFSTDHKILYDPVKHLQWSFFAKIVDSLSRSLNLRKIFFIDVWQDSKYVPAGRYKRMINFYA